MASVRVLIAVHQLLVRNGLKQVLAEEYRDVVFGEARTAGEVLQQVGDQPWDLVVLDIGIPVPDGYYVLGETLRRRPATRVLMLGDQENSVDEARSRQMGACGYICMDAVRSHLVKAFRNVLAGKAQFDGSLPPDSAAPATPGHEVLSAREYKVLLAFGARQAGP